MACWNSGRAVSLSTINSHSGCSSVPSAELTIDDEQRIFALFAYEYLPESTFFLVYNNNREKDGDTEQIVFVKLAHLLKVGLF